MMLDPHIQLMIQKYGNRPLSDLDKLREILQQVALLGLSRAKFFEKAAFYGGTALRILYGLDRFSEDLDFTLLARNPRFDFDPYLESMRQEIVSFGFDLSVEIKEKTKETGIVSAFLKTNTLQLLLSMGKKSGHPDQKLTIKLEIDVDPPLGFRTEPKLVPEPVPFYVLTLQPSDLFAGKMHAVLFRNWKNRVKGRDWYDLIWYIKNGIPLNLAHLEERMKQLSHFSEESPLTPKLFFQLLNEKIEKINWSLAADDVRAFVPDPKLLDLWSAAFFKDLARRIQIETE